MGFAECYKNVNIDKLKGLVESMDKECWIEDGVSDLVIGWIEPELDKLGIGYGIINEPYDNLSVAISDLCRGLLRGFLKTAIRAREIENENR